MKNIRSSIGFVILFAFCCLKVKAGIIVSDVEEINFSLNKIPQNITWSDNFSLKETGLETKQLPQNQSQDIWVQTHAFPIGLSWRPPNSASFMVSFDGSINEIALPYGLAPRIFIRYTCDKVNWSTWYNFSDTNKKTNEGLKIHEGKIWLPSSASERYYKLMQDWWKTNPIWSSDETEFCEWLVKKEPDFFINEKPFIGYVQVRIEKMSVNSSQNIKSMSIQYTWGVGGLTSISNDKSKVRKNTEDKWFFEGKKN